MIIIALPTMFAMIIEPIMSPKTAATKTRRRVEVSWVDKFET